MASETGDILKVRGLLRRPMADRWNANTIKSITTTPWCLRSIASTDRIDLGERVPRHEPAQDERAPNPLRLKITMRLLQELFNETKPGLAHSEACRKRVVESIQATPGGAEALDRQENRINRAMTEQIDVAERQAAGVRPV